MNICGQKILTIGPSFKNYSGGIGAVIALYSKHFDSFNFYSSYEDNNYKHLFSLIKMLWFPFFMLGKKEIQIVHIHGASKGSFFRKYYYFFWSKYIFKKKVIYHIHGGKYNLFIKDSKEPVKKIIEKMLIGADKVIVLSNSWKAFFLHHFPKIKIEKLYNGIEYIKKTECKLTPQSGINFLFLGKISEEKGVFDIIDVAEMLIKQKKEFTIQIGGNGNTEKVIERLKNSNLTNVIKFLGWVAGERKNKLFETSSVYLLPSYNEGLPISILEAMAFGLPVIASNVGGIPELVTDNESGFIVNPGDRVMLMEKMNYFIDNPDEIDRMGKYSKQIIKTKFSTEIIFKQLNKMYQSLEVNV